MGSNPSEALVKDLLSHLKEHPDVLASPEDADFFRKRLKKEIPLPPAPKKIEPVIIKQPEPVVIEKKVAPPPIKEIPPPPTFDARLLEISLEDVRKIVQRAAPELPILNEIPSDASAKKQASRWKTKNLSAPISILSLSEPPQQRALLEQIAKAIEVHFGAVRIVSAETIEKEKQWDAFLSVPELKLVIACDYTLWQLSDLMRFFKETPANGERMLKTAPLFLLPDLSLYLKDPLLKRSLWKALCQKLSS
jgi:hypothetical protein